MLKWYSKLVQFENLLSKPIFLFSIFSLGNMKYTAIDAINACVTACLLHEPFQLQIRF